MKMLDIRFRRLHAQQLDGEGSSDPVEVLSKQAAMQGQDYRAAKWALGLRTSRCAAVDVEAALADHRILRTWLFRGTLHFAAAPDLAWLTALAAPDVIRKNQRRYRQLALDDQVFSEALDLIEKALSDGGPMTRPQIKSALHAAAGRLGDFEGLGAELKFE